MIQPHPDTAAPPALHRHTPAPRPRGHSLVELLVVIGIIALVIAMIAGVFFKVYRVIESWI